MFSTRLIPNPVSRNASQRKRTKRRSTERRLSRVIESLEARQMMAADAAITPVMDFVQDDGVAAWVAVPETGNSSAAGADQSDSTTVAVAPVFRQ